MSDWQVGDLAVCVRGCELKHDATPDPDFGVSVVVNGIMRVGPGYTGDPDGGLRLVLGFVGYPGIYCAGCFRKVRPDEREACEPEFVTLLKRAKRRVSA